MNEKNNDIRIVSPSDEVKVENILSINDIPGPQETMKGDFMTLQRFLHDKFGSITKFFIGDALFLSTTNVKNIKNCSKNKSNKPEKLYKFLDPLIGNVMFWPKPEIEELNQLIRTEYSPKLLKEQFSFIVEQITNAMNSWLNESKKSYGILKIQNKTKALAMRLNVSLIFGIDYPDSEILGEAIHHALKSSLKLQFQGKDDITQQELDRNITFINSITSELIKLYKESEKKKKVFYTELCSKYDNEKNLVIIKMMLMAGYHTVASSIAWTLYAIAKNPTVAKTILDEINQVLGKKDLEFNDIIKFKYLDCVIKESFRLYTVAPYTAREIDHTILKGEKNQYSIIEKTILFIPITAVHMSENDWSQPEEFKPERFANSKCYNKDVFMPFGVRNSSRSCPGMIISPVLIKLLLIQMMRTLSFQVAPGFEPQFTENFVLISKNDIQLKIQNRVESSLTNNFLRLAQFALILTLGFAILTNGRSNTSILAFILLCSYLLKDKNSQNLYQNQSNFFAKISKPAEQSSTEQINSHSFS